MCLGATAGTAVTSFSVFIGECSLDILALKFSTMLASPGDEVEAELFNSDCIRDSADLFLTAAENSYLVAIGSYQLIAPSIKTQIATRTAIDQVAITEVGLPRQLSTRYQEQLCKVCKLCKVAANDLQIRV